MVTPTLAKLVAMYIFVLLSSSFVFFLCSFLGLLLLKLLKLQSNTLDNHIANSFWVGYSMFISLLFFINLFLPVNIISIIPIFLTLTIISIMLNKEFLIKYTRSIHPFKYLAYFIGLNALAFIYLRSNTYQGYSFDTYNYHFYILRLINEYPAIKGIINLFPHLSNIYSTIYHASFLKIFSPHYFFDNYLFFIAVHTLILAILITVTSVLKSHISKSTSSKNKFYDNFAIISLFIVLIYPLSMPGTWQGSERLLGHFPDIAYYLLSYVLILYFYKFITNTNRINFLLLIFIAVSTIFVKASSLFLVFIIICISSFIWFRHRKANSRIYFVYISLAIILTIPYILQHIIKSGALIFPVYFTNLNLAWSNADALTRYVAGALSWARSNHATPHDSEFAYFGWISSWLKSYSIFLLYHIGIYITLLGTLLIIFIKDERFYKKTKNNILALFIIWVPSILFWFLTAPDVRFAGILFLMPTMVMFTIIYTYFIVIEKREILLKTIFTFVIPLSISYLYILTNSISSIIISLTLSIGILALLYHYLNKKISTQNRYKQIVILTAFSLLLIKGVNSHERIFSLNRPIPNTDNTFIKEVYDGVNIYIGEWANNKYCSYTKLLPVSYRKDYVFINSEKWSEGFLPKKTNK